jgi:hypothetical protein
MSSSFLDALWRSVSTVLNGPDVAARFVSDWAATAKGSCETTQKSDAILAAVRSNMDGAQVVCGYFPAILSLPLFSYDNPERLFWSETARCITPARKEIDDAKDALMRSDSASIELIDDWPFGFH